MVQRAHWMGPGRMSGFTLPVSRPVGRAIIVGTAGCRALPGRILSQLGYQVVDADDPYVAMAELCRRPPAYRTVVISLNAVYREELQMIATVKGRFPHVDVWLAHTDGRAAALAEASRLGADGLVSEEGLHRFAIPTASATPQPKGESPAEGKPAERAATPTAERSNATEPEAAPAEPVLSADELRALLEDQPAEHPTEKKS